MARPLKVLHLASFAGNNGDGAMHDGACRTRAEDLPFRMDCVADEIRDYAQWGRRRFDESFVDRANQCDVLLVGGVSLFQLWRAEGATGTYFDLPQELLARIRRPMAFYGLGCDATRGIREDTAEKIRRWLDAALETGRATFSLRNDGTQALLADALGADYAGRMEVIPDGALFAEPGGAGAAGGDCVVVNVAGDMPDVRFAGRSAEFAQALAAEIEGLLAAHPECRCHLAPNVHSDLGLIAQCLAAMDDRLRRTRVSVGAYDAGPEGWRTAYGAHRGARAAVAMRFHANVVSVGLGVPTTGLSSHHKVVGFYREMGLADRCVECAPEHGREALAAAFRQAGADLQPAAAARARKRQRLVRDAARAKLKAYHGRLGEWLMGQLGGGSGG
jgi:polysaccharide pyruvyl transferase WcaK-like protein